MSRSLRSRPDARRLGHLLLFVACASVVLSLSAVAAGARSRHPRCKKHHSATCPRSPKKRGAGPRATTAAQRAPVLSVRGKTLKWNRIGTANSYVIATTVGSDRAHTAYKAVTGTSYTPPAVAAKSVHYVVRVNQSGSPWSNEVTVTYPVASTLPPPTPTPSAPDARFAFSPASPATGQEVTFDGRSSTCAATPCTYTWEDVGAGGTGSWPLGSGQTMVFTFGNAGTKYVRLSVRDAQGRSDTMTKNVVVQAAPPPPTSPPPTTPPPPGSSCATTVSSTAAAQTAVSAAANGETICIADGTYGKLTLNATKAAPGVTVRPVTSGGATIAGASLQGGQLTLSRFRVVGAEVTIPAGSKHMTVDHNYLTGGYFGVVAGNSTRDTADDIVIRGNKFQGPFGEDAIRANRYHDADGDGRGLYVAFNEFTGVENGNHSDCLQTVWVGDHIVFDHNYLHDNHCQGFFVKDQAAVPGGGNVTGPVNGLTLTNNLFARDNLPCVGAAAGRGGGDAPIDIFGPTNDAVVDHNTVWSDDNSSVYAIQDGPWGSLAVTNNAFRYLYASGASSAFDYGYTASGNVTCVPGNHPTTGFTTNCDLSFPAATLAGGDDWRLGSGQPGVDWKPSDYHYGP